MCEKDLFFGVESQLWCAVSDRFRAQAVMHCWSETLDPGKCSSGLEGFYQLERTVKVEAADMGNSFQSVWYLEHR